MERNPTDNLGTSGAGMGAAGNDIDSARSGTDMPGSSSDSSGYGGTSGYAGTASDRNTGSTAGSGVSDRIDQAKGAASDALHQASDRLSDARDAASDKLSQARDMASERLGQAKEKAGQLKSSLADKLEAGASSLRQQAQGGGQGDYQQLAGAGAGGSAAGLLQSDQIQRLAGPAADAMERTADFLRNGDLKEMLEEQVRENPARTLLIALGVGYLLGKAIRR